MMRFFLVSIDGSPVAEFVTPHLLELPDVIIWQTRAFRYCEPGATGRIYEEETAYFMPPQHEVVQTRDAVLEEIKTERANGT